LNIYHVRYQLCITAVCFVAAAAVTVRRTLLTDLTCVVQQGQRRRGWHRHIISSAHLSNDVNYLLAVYASR